jgi:hypothetical protein
LYIYQNCVAPAGWFNVSQSGFPVDPANVTAAPAFLSGDGTIATPYQCSVTTTLVGTTVLVVNTVTVTGLVPFQHVPIIDLNAVANVGRFSFSNSYADAAGTLVFQIIFQDLPQSVPGTSYTAAIRVGSATAYIDAIVNIVISFVTTAGSISGTPEVGQVLTYTTGVASDGVPPYVYSWVWKRDGVTIAGATASTYTLVAADNGKSITVTLTATDAAADTATATTAPVGPVTKAVFPPGVWDPTPSGAMTSGNPGTSSGVWSGPNGSVVQATGCVEVSINGTSYSASVTVNAGQTLYQRWKQTPACGGSASGTTITGTVSSSAYENSYSLALNRVPAPPIGDISDTNVNLAGTVTKAIAAPISGINSTAYVTYDSSSTGTVIQASTDNVTFTTLSTSGTGFSVTDGQTLYIRQTVGSAITTGYTAVLRVGDGTNTPGTYDEFTYTATTVSTAAFPNLPAPLQTGPVSIPETVSGTWADGSTSLTSTDCLLISTNNVSFNQGPLSVVNGNTLYMKWDPAGATCGDAADGATITGDLTNGVNVESYSLTLDRTPNAFTLTPIAGQAVTSTATSNIITLSGTNAPAYITYTAGAPDTLVNPKVSINGGAYVSVPTSGTTVSAPPGATLTFQGDTGSTLFEDYTVTFNVGSTSSAWSVDTVLAVGVPYEGGYFAGQINDGGTIYNLVVAPRATGQFGGGAFSELQWGISNTSDTPTGTFENQTYGKPANDAANDASHPAFLWARGLNIGGYTDWYVPAKNELEVLCYNLKPNTIANSTFSGANPDAVPPRPSNYTISDPAQTIADGTNGTANFRVGGSEAFDNYDVYWSSSQAVSPDGGSAWWQAPGGNNTQSYFDKNNGSLVRVIRRVPA